MKNSTKLLMSIFFVTLFSTTILYSQDTTPSSVRGTIVDGSTGDILVGDDSGVVVVPHEMAKEVLETTKKIEEAENFIVEAVRSGLSLKEAREKFGYHTLQTKKPR